MLCTEERKTKQVFLGFVCVLSEYCASMAQRAKANIFN